jgi:hypothetical protein
MDPGTVKAEYLDRGMMATVNGQSYEGPLTIFRSYDIRGAAICPAGADKFTSAEFAATEAGEFSITLQQSGNPMSVTTSAATAEPAAAVAATVTTVVTPANTGTLSRAEEGRKFLIAFGDFGATCFAEGLSFEEAQTKFTARLKAENEELRRKLGGLSLAAGGKSPIGTAAEVLAAPGLGLEGQLSAGLETPAEGEASPLQQKWGKNLGSFMSACQPPNARK